MKFQQELTKTHVKTKNHLSEYTLLSYIVKIDRAS